MKNVVAASVLLLWGAGAHAVTLTTLHSFTGPDGAQPYAGLIRGPDGNLFGTTVNGGASDSGTIFRIGVDGSGYTRLHSFSALDGALPHGGLVADKNGNLFGTTARGGAFDTGTIFRIRADGGDFQTIHSFDTFGGGGINPYAGLVVGDDGRLYGTTVNGGRGGGGTIFRVGANGGYETIFTFPRDPRDVLSDDLAEVRPGDELPPELLYPQGRSPYGSLLAKGSFLFGTTERGGAADRGTIFSVRTDGFGFTVLHSFSGLDGAGPFAGLVADLNGNLFGTTSGGGDSDLGTIFTIRLDGSGFATLHSFSGEDGDFPNSSLLLGGGGGGSLYGTTTFGGLYFGGTIFQYSFDSGELTTLYNFGFGIDGSDPRAALFGADNGDLFGTTQIGGSKRLGTVFRLSGSDFAPNLPVVPEPGTWAMMIAGFGLVGSAMRRRTRVAA